MKTPPTELAERLWQVADRALQQGGEIRIDDLAELTGVPRATLYYYFSGKDDVLAFLLAQQLQRGTATIAAAVHSRGGAAERLDAVLRAMLHTMAEHPALCTRLMGVMANGVGGAQVMAEAERTLMAPVRDLLVDAHHHGELVGPDGHHTVSHRGRVDHRHGPNRDQHLRPRPSRRTPHPPVPRRAPTTRHTRDPRLDVQS